MKFANLRGIMASRNVKLYHLSAHLRVSDGYLSLRLSGRKPFQEYEKQRISQYFSLPQEWLFEEFRPPVMRRETAMLTPAAELR